MVFLDYFLTRDLFARLAREGAGQSEDQVQLMPARGTYLACTGSFLVRRSSAAYLSQLLARVLEAADPLAPVDLTLRMLLQIGAISGLVSVPPLGAPAWEEDDSSTVQTHARPEIRRAQRAHLLLRLLASGQQSACWCAQRLAEIYGESSPLSPAGGAEDFLAHFDLLQPRMPVF